MAHPLTTNVGLIADDLTRKGRTPEAARAEAEESRK